MSTNARFNGNEAIDNFVLGNEKRNWKHRYIGNDECPVCDLEKMEICSPALPPAVDETLDRIVRAKNEHEVGHAKFTPLSLCGDMRKWGNTKRNLVNALEDLRIEKALSSLKCGGDVIKEDLRFLNDTLIDDLNHRMASGATVKIGIVDEAIMAMQFDENGHAPIWTLSSGANALYQVASPIFAKWKHASLDKDGFATIKTIADEIIAKWNGMGNQGNQGGQGKKGGQGNSSGNQGNQDGENSGNSSDNQGNSNSSDNQENASGNQANQENGDKAENQGKDAKNANGKGDDKGKGENASDKANQGENASRESKGNQENGNQENQGENASGNGNQANQDNSHSPSKVNPIENANASGDMDNSALDKESSSENALNEILKEKIKDGISEIKESYGDYTSCREYDKILVADEDKLGFYNAYSSIRGMVATLTSHLEQSLRSMSRCRVMRGRDKGNLDMTKMVAISKSLDKNIFCTKTNGISLDVSVSILIDESGSIGDMCYDFRRVAIAFCEALERLGIKFEVLGHTTGYECDKSGSFTRFRAMRIYEHKRFNQPYRAEKLRLGSISSYNMNIDGEALLTTVRRCLAQRTSRHIVLVLSDGQPNQGGNYTQICNHLMQVVKHSREMGVEIYAFGIRTNEPKQFYGDDNFLYIEDTNKMDGQFMRSFANIITKGNLKG